MLPWPDTPAMDLPALLADHLEGESVRERVDLDGDQVVVTPTRTLVYRAEGLISDEAVSAFPTEVDRLDVSTGRKATFEFSYIDGTRSFRVGGSHAEDVLRAVLSGVLAANGVVDPDETVRASFRFEELTFVVTDDRAVKHVGGAVWDEEFETYPFADLTGLTVEEGVHATQLVLEVDGRPHRVKIPADDAPLVRRALEEAVFAHYDVDSAAALEAEIAPADEDEDEKTEPGSNPGGVEPLIAVEDDGSEGASGSETEGPAGLEVGLAGAGGADAGGQVDPEDVAAELAALREAVETQTELLRAQEEAIDRLVAELRRDSDS